jgi:hypothetical protein
MVVRYHHPNALPVIECHASRLLRSLAFAEMCEEGFDAGSDVSDAGTIRPMGLAGTLTSGV